jgi:hypothetical protein
MLLVTEVLKPRWANPSRLTSAYAGVVALKQVVRFGGRINPATIALPNQLHEIVRGSANAHRTLRGLPRTQRPWEIVLEPQPLSGASSPSEAGAAIL